MARQHRSHSVAFKRQVAQEYLAGESLHGLAKRHDLARNLIAKVGLELYSAAGPDARCAPGCSADGMTAHKVSSSD